jgi:hypothetical protein
MAQFGAPEICLSKPRNADPLMVDSLFQLAQSVLTLPHSIPDGKTLTAPQGKLKIEPSGVRGRRTLIPEPARNPPAPDEPPGEIRLAGLRHEAARRLPVICLPWYISTMVNESQLLVERVQTGVRIEKRLLKVLKALAEYHDMSLGDLLEGIVLHAFDGKIPFPPSSLKRIQELKKFYSLDLDSSASHRLTEIKRRSRNNSSSEKKK